MKLLKVVGVSHQYFKDFGGKTYFDKNNRQYKNIEPPKERKYGNVKNPKNGSRPYLLFIDEGGQL